MSGAARANKGYTLLETVIALAVWAVLAITAAGMLAYTARANMRLTESSLAFENARVSLDALSVNIQMADTIVLETDHNGVLRQLTLTERAPNGSPANYIFYFSKTAQPGEAKYHRLEFGLNDEFASHIETVKLVYADDGYIAVTVTTDDTLGEPLTLTASVDARYKNVTVKLF